MVGLGLAAVGGYHVYKRASKKFLKDLRVFDGTGITAVGVAGYVAKGVVLAGAGILVIIASSSRRFRPTLPRQQVSTPRSRHSVMPRSARSYSSWPRLVSRPSARTASCAPATAACSRYIGAPDWDSAWYSAAICIGWIAAPQPRCISISGAAMPRSS